MITVHTNAPGCPPIGAELALIAALTERRGAPRVEVVHLSEGRLDGHMDYLNLHAAALSEGVSEVVRKMLKKHPDLTVDQAFADCVNHIKGMLDTRLEELRAEFATRIPP